MKKLFTMMVVLVLALALALPAAAESVLADEFHAAWDAFHAMEETMPEDAEYGQVSRATTLRIFSSNLQLTLPTGCSLYNSTSTSAYYVDSQTGLMFAVSKMESYASIADWKAVLEYDGQDVSYGYINDVLAVIGLTYDSGFQVSCFVNSGYSSYLIMCAGATENQALYFIDILGTLCTASSTTPTAAPTATPTAAPTATPSTGPLALTQKYQIMGSGTAIYLTSDMYVKASSDTTVQWNSPAGNINLFFTKSSTAHSSLFLSSMASVWAEMGLETDYYSFDGITTLVCVGEVDTGWMLYAYYNDNNRGYTISTTDRTADEILLVAQIMDTLHKYDPSTNTPTPAPTAVPTAIPTAAPTATPAPGSYTAVPLRDSGLELYLDASAYLSSSNDSRDYWYDKTNRLSFFLYEENSYDSLSEAAKFFANTMKYDVEWIVYNDIPGFRASQVNSYNTDLHSVRYYFSADEQLYYVTAASLKTAELTAYDNYVRTIHWADNNHGTLRLPDGLNKVEYLSFHNTDAYKVVVPYGCTTIETNAFASMDKLTIVEIPVTVTSISSSAFDNCSSELTIVAPAGSYASTFAASEGYNFCAIK